MLLQCIALDDEPLALDLLEDSISKLPYLHLVAKCSDAFEAMKAMQENKIDLIFADIQMPGLTGLQFIETVVEKPMVIVITAYEKFALEGYNLDVVDYLLKPVSLDRFIKACHKARDLYHLKNADRLVNSANSEYFFLNVDYSLVKIRFDDIVWIEGLRDYIKIHLKSSPNPLVVRMGMKVIEEQLPTNKFIRIHKSFILSIEAITAVRKSSVFIHEQEFTVGDTYKDAILQLTGKDRL